MSFYGGHFCICRCLIRVTEGEKFRCVRTGDLGLRNALIISSSCWSLVQRFPLSGGGFQLMEVYMDIFEFLDLFIHVLFYPLDPVTMMLDENPFLLICLVVLVGMSIFGVFRGIYVKLLRGV